MILQGWLQILIFFAVIVALTPLLGGYMARVYTPGQTVMLERVLGPFERLLYRIFGANPSEGQDWKRYARSVVFFSLIAWLVMYAILRTQTLHPWSNYPGVQFHSGTWDVTFNTVSSFVTNTNWQYYGGETTLTYFSQMMGLTVENFVSAAVGICVVIAMIRGIISRSGSSLGNFWQDLVRTLLYVLLPLSVIGTLLLVSQGVIQNLGPLHHRAHAGRRHAVARPGPGRVADRDQAARDQRRRVLQHQLGVPVRERQPVLELRRDAVHHLDSGCAHLHVRADGRQPPPGLGDLRRDVRALRRDDVGRVPGRAARNPGAARCRRDHAGDCRLYRREHGGQGAAQRRCQLGAVGLHDDGHVQRLGQRLDGVDDRHWFVGAADQPGYERGRVRRRRHRPVLDAGVRAAGRVHRRA